MTEQSNKMPDWVLLEARKRAGYKETDTHVLRNNHYQNLPVYQSLCDMILKYEQRPVDRKLSCAREALARRYSHAQTSYRNGTFDNNLVNVVAAIALYEEGFGK